MKPSPKEIKTFAKIRSQTALFEQLRLPKYVYRANNPSGTKLSRKAAKGALNGNVNSRSR